MRLQPALRGGQDVHPGCRVADLSQGFGILAGHMYQLIIALLCPNLLHPACHRFVLFLDTVLGFCSAIRAVQNVLHVAILGGRCGCTFCLSCSYVGAYVRIMY